MNPTFSCLASRFFNSHLPRERGLSPNTIAAYSDCMRLLIDYVCGRFGTAPERIATDMLDRDLVLDFLDHLECERGNGISTRNLRLAAIKSFFHFLARTVPGLMHLNECIQAIRPKRAEQVPPPSLTAGEVDAIIAAPDSTDLLGARDRALLQMLYNTGARVQKIADLTVADIRFDNPATVRLTGKGRKTRIVPLWPETVRIVQHYLQFREQRGIEADHLFLSIAGRPITRSGIARRVEIHARAAAQRCPSLGDRRITPHIFRHTIALHLIEAGNDITIVKEWLGHADLRTTSRYTEVSIQRKRKALEKVPIPGSSAQREPPIWKQQPIMDLLLGLSRRKRYVVPKPCPQKPTEVKPPRYAT